MRAGRAVDPSSFAEVLRQYRRGLGLTQEELAERAQLSARAVSDLERGINHSPRPTTIRLLVKALELAPNEAAHLRSAAQSHSPAVRPTQGPHLSRHNLPAELSSFVGRERELTDVEHRLLTTRLLTLTGVGGIGKTRLALRLATNAVSMFPDGVWLVELASLADATVVPQVVATVLGVHEQPGRPVLASLSESLVDRQLLVVLDNCEHLVQACAELADHLLRECLRLRILATSREPLGVPGEVTWSVSALSLPPESGAPAESLRQSEAVELFLERAAAAAPGFAKSSADLPAVSEICRRLDGIPLEIELAAARVPVLSVDEIAARLDHRFDVLTLSPRTAARRQQTLRATVSWSYDLLSDAERRLLERASVFAGGWTFEDAEAVCAGDGIAPEDVLDLLGRLVSKSLVLHSPAQGGSRYRLLETIRAYAEEQLAQRGAEGSIRSRYAEHYLGLAEEWMAAVLRGGPERRLWLDRLEGEHANFRQVLRWVVDSRADEDTRLRWAAALGTFWYFRGYYAEGRAWRTALDIRPDAARPTRNWGQARARREVSTTGWRCLDWSHETTRAGAAGRRGAGGAERGADRVPGACPRAA